MERINAGSAPIPEGVQRATLPSAIRVAVLDSDSGFVRVLLKRLQAIGWQARVFPGLPRAEELPGMRVDAIVIDPALVGDEAWSYLEKLCAAGGPSVVVCTAPTTVAQRVRGLRLGADDWITKPCHPEEVLARVEAAARRRRAGAERSESLAPIVVGELEIRPDMFDAFVGGRPLQLTRREYELLHLLAASDGKVIPREQIYQRVWGYTMIRGDRSVDVFVRKLRKKLEDASPGWRYLHTHFGVGYRFESLEIDSMEPPGERIGLPPT